MLEILMIITGVFVGNALFYAALFVLCMNDKFIKWYSGLMVRKICNMADDDLKDII